MKSLMYKIILSLTLIVIVQINFIAAERAYGKDRTTKSTPPAKPDPFLRPEIEGDHISEANILFTIDEADIEPAGDAIQIGRASCRERV